MQEPRLFKVEKGMKLEVSFFYIEWKRMYGAVIKESKEKAENQTTNKSINLYRKHDNTLSPYGTKKGKKKKPYLPSTNVNKLTRVCLYNSILS